MKKLIGSSLTLAPLAVCFAFIQGCSSQIAPLDDGGDSESSSTAPPMRDRTLGSMPDWTVGSMPGSTLESMRVRTLALTRVPMLGLMRDRMPGLTPARMLVPPVRTLARPSSAGLPNTSAQMATGDFNGDGRLDLVVSLGWPRATTTRETSIFLGTAVKVLLGNGDGSFQTPVTLITGVSPAWRGGHGHRWRRLPGHRGGRLPERQQSSVVLPEPAVMPASAPRRMWLPRSARTRSAVVAGLSGSGVPGWPPRAPDLTGSNAVRVRWTPSGGRWGLQLARA